MAAALVLLLAAALSGEAAYQRCDQGWAGPACRHCGGKARRVSNSVITDGMGPYPAGTTCSWLVVGRQNTTVRLLLEHFEMECGSSHLYVHDGRGMDAPLVAVLTGVLHRNDHHVARSHEIVTHSGYAFVHYTAHTDVNTSAFKISVKVGSCPRDAEGRDCSGHGRCVVTTCFCNEGHQGEACDEPSCPGGCSGSRNGECNSKGTCDCKQGFTGNIWRRLKTNQTPAPRYGHTAVIHDNVIYVYGGTLEKGGVTSELWALDLTSRAWENVTVTPPDCAPAAACGPIALVGHSANVVFKEYMVVFFGYSPQYGIINTVQEFHFGNRTWKAVDTYDYPVSGSYGHTSSWDELSGLVYVLGGYRRAGLQPSNELFSYEPRERTWRLLHPAPLALYLHAATFTSGGMLLAHGGNGRTAAPASSCLSPAVLSYDVLCDSWGRLPVRSKPARSDLARFGHSAVAFARSLVVFAGYNGRIMSDLLRFIPGSCETMDTIGDCVDSQLGVKCVWNHERLACQSVDSLPERPRARPDPVRDSSEDQEHRYCRYNESAVSAVGEEVCSRQPDCLSCTSTSFHCAWLDSGKCTLINVSGKMARTASDKCVDREKALCARHDTCRSCVAAVGCVWDETICRDFNRSVDDAVPSAESCPAPCDSRDNCADCTQDGCLWCESDGRCVDPEAEVISYPYGQCLLWAREATRCPATGESWCQGHLTCADCIQEPACGWCDDGPLSGGTGSCMPGGFKNTEADFCRARFWHFVDCPDCQCNGHSNCSYGVCNQPCADRTHGLHCETCDAWFHGNPLNGGRCSACSCSGDAVDCEAASGRCVCSTRGVTGARCEACDPEHGFLEDPELPGTCFYDLPVNYQFVFNASEDDEPFQNINFISVPLTEKINMTFRIECLNHALMNITVRTASGTEKFLVTNHQFSEERPLFERRFRVLEEASKVVAFRVHLRELAWPAQLSLSFSQAAAWPRSMQYAPVALSFSMFVVVSALSSKYF
ncbi:attractin-like protein 1 isoform X2 [Bacillus rossius redtenbacheri]|uniref:attractin-like protein 1 isoform X2 n=1 Tax=Bacillus rossius redtenbacheri TaxID=93214 RepID=UPI002FDC8D91